MRLRWFARSLSLVMVRSLGEVMLAGLLSRGVWKFSNVRKRENESGFALVHLGLESALVESFSSCTDASSRPPVSDETGTTLRYSISLTLRK